MKTTCPYCGVGCGIDVNQQADGSVSISGDQSHPANFGRLCSKGSALAETLDLDDRLLQPSVGGEETDWDSALNTVASRFSAVIAEHGPDAVAFYVSGQLLTEDYYVANKLMKGFIGSANIDTNSRLCMSSSVAAHKRAFGSDSVPGCYEDFELAELVLLIGSNTAWCHPVLYQRLVAAKAARPDLKIVVIDPRQTATCDIADLHLPLKPGSDSVLFNGLLNWLYQQDLCNTEFIDQHCEDVTEALRSAQWSAPSIAAVAQHCELEVDAIARLFDWFAACEKTISLYSQGINQSSSGTDKVNAIINCHLLTGRIGKPGMGPFSITGQPNAMGGREVGALSNQLAAHMDFAADDVDRVGRFWRAENMAYKPGLKAIELFEAVERGEIKALWVMATNPAVSMPDAGRVQQALKKCEFLVVSDCVRQTDTSVYADVLLPALGWSEKDGTVTNSERRISRQRAFLPPAGEARADWWILSRVAERMGFKGFDYQRPQQVFVEHAALSAFENKSRAFDLSGLAALSAEEYEDLQPLQWPVKKNQRQGQPRLFANAQFQTASRKAHFIAVTPTPPGSLADVEYPLILNSGRLRDQWHTMTRTGKSPRLNAHASEPTLQIHPDDAKTRGIADGQLLQIKSRYGESILRASLTESQQAGQVFAPIHWNEQFGNGGRIGAVVNPYQDEFSGQPEFKHTPVEVKAYAAGWHGFVLSREVIDTSQFDYWVRVKRQSLWQYEVAGITARQDWADFAHTLLNQDSESRQWSELSDSSQLSYRAASFKEGRLDACIFIAADHQLPPRDWLIKLFSESELSARQRQRILAASPAAGDADAGKIICACFSVGINTLCKAVRDYDIQSTEQFGERLQAGTNCGSCLPELRQIIAQSS